MRRQIAKACSTVLVAAAAALMAGSPAMADLAVDGSLSDWGVTVADGNGSSFPIGPGFADEDQSDTAGDGGFLGPNHGGQNYDVEFLGAMIQGTDLFVAIVSGQRPDNGFSRYGPGDIYFTTTTGIYGLEVGGGVGGGAGTAITEGAAGATYTFGGSGFTTGHTATAPAAGSLWKSPTWIMDPIAPATPTELDPGTGTMVGTADYYFSRDSVTTQHSIIELSIPMSLFDASTTVTGVSWSPICGNDFLHVEPSVIPAPGAALLAGLGMTMIGAVRRRFA